MPSSLLIAGATGAATAAGTHFGTKLFGPKSGNVTAPLSEFQLPSINAGGLSGRGGEITPSAERLGLVKNIGGLFGQQAGLTADLRSRVAPGISELRASRLAEIEGARQNAIGNLRENLQRRRVLGSSFGQDTLARAEAEFGQQKERVAAESFLQEIDLTNQFINQEFQTRRGEFQTALDEMNFEAGIAANLVGKATDILGKNAQILSALNAQEAAGAGKFFGQTFQPAFKGFGESVGEFFKKGFATA